MLNYKKAVYLALAAIEVNKNNESKVWTREWMTRCENLGAYNLVKELAIEDDMAFSNYLRIDHDLFKMISEKISPLIYRRDTNMRKAICVEERLAITLRYLATGNSYATLEYHFRRSKAIISSIVPETCEAIYSVLKDKYFKTPNTEAEWKAISDDFLLTWQFPNTLGALDGKHIHIKAVPGGGSEYYNYKGRNSVVLMALVDAKYRFLYCNIGVNGRISDGGVYRRCNLSELVDDPQNPLSIPNKKPLPGRNTSVFVYVFIADEAFPLKEHILKPYANRGQSEMEFIFSKRLSRARRVVENAFGIMTSRFRVLSSEIDLEPKKVDKIVLACCVLSNLLLKEKKSLNIQNESRVEIENLERNTQNTSTLAVRQARDEFRDWCNNEGSIKSLNELYFNK